ncbi:unnamed protein product [Ambrosiozyma monospora]|uniref:Unnamed protein product n=1 Tax=Ambrosiozyma monospora TaxID=43982 RepID=A0ACB5TRX4_AMBMO|nr:unnamed protein product [Ambrosiozyma monospora]
MDPASKLLWKRSLIFGGGIILSGVLLYKFTTPTPEQLIARLSPELRADYERNKELREKEQQILMEIVQKTAASNEPAWKTGPIPNPWDRNNVQTSESILVKKELFEKEQAKNAQLEKLEKLKKEAELTDELVGENNVKKVKSWYKFW